MSLSENPHQPAKKRSIPHPLHRLIRRRLRHHPRNLLSKCLNIPGFLHISHQLIHSLVVHFPVETLSFYGPDYQLATKLVCGVITYEGADPIILEKWFSITDIRHSESVLAEVLNVVEGHQVKTVLMVEQIIGCPHEEGIDYPEGESCPVCPYWTGRDRFVGEVVH
ncbi:hypothetical protein [Endozoicomonas sp.]|uniref:hypothetical protein n=1 Tax=Endozoicomonas sp. TaxID=1892382 RepID=UPI00383A0375